MRLGVVTLCSRLSGLEPLVDSLVAAPLPPSLVPWWLILFDQHAVDQRAAAEAATAAIHRLRLTDAKRVWTYSWHCHEAPDGWAPEPCLRNVALGLTAHRFDTWLHFVDDDNLLHRDLPTRFMELVVEDEDMALARTGEDLDGPGVIEPPAAYVFDQTARNGEPRLRAAPESMHFGGVDTAQVVFRRPLVPASLSFDNRSNGCDGLFYDSLYQSAPRRFRFVNEALCYHNAQRG